MRAFGERHRSVAVLAGGCEALFTPRPLGPLLDIAAEVGGELAELTERGASAGEVLAALGRALRGPSIVVLEDLHWADEATLDVVQLLGRRVARMPALVIATYRDDELGRDHPLRVVLGELGAGAADDGASRCRRAPWRGWPRRTASTAPRCMPAPAATRSS